MRAGKIDKDVEEIGFAFAFAFSFGMEDRQVSILDTNAAHFS